MAQLCAAESIEVEHTGLSKSTFIFFGVALVIFGGIFLVRACEDEFRKKPTDEESAENEEVSQKASYATDDEKQEFLEKPQRRAPTTKELVSELKMWVGTAGVLAVAGGFFMFGVAASSSFWVVRNMYLNKRF